MQIVYAQEHSRYGGVRSVEVAQVMEDGAIVMRDHTHSGDVTTREELDAYIRCLADTGNYGTRISKHATSWKDYNYKPRVGDFVEASNGGARSVVEIVDLYDTGHADVYVHHTFLQREFADAPEGKRLYNVHPNFIKNLVKRP